MSERRMRHQQEHLFAEQTRKHSIVAPGKKVISSRHCVWVAGVCRERRNAVYRVAFMCGDTREAIYCKFINFHVSSTIIHAIACLPDRRALNALSPVEPPPFAMLNAARKEYEGDGEVWRGVMDTDVFV